MSRALLVIAFAQALGREPTDAEKFEFLKALAGLAGGEYLYVPKPHVVADSDLMRQFRDGGASVRKIAKTLGVSKSSVARILRGDEVSQISPYERDSEAA